MAKQRPTFLKTQRERDKQARAAAKRDRRQGRAPGPIGAEDDVAAPDLTNLPDQLSPAELLALIETVHRRYEAGEIGFEEFEDTKVALLSRLPVD